MAKSAGAVPPSLGSHDTHIRTPPAAPGNSTELLSPLRCLLAVRRRTGVSTFKSETAASAPGRLVLPPPDIRFVPRSTWSYRASLPYNGTMVSLLSVRSKEYLELYYEQFGGRVPTMRLLPVRKHGDIPGDHATAPA